MSSKACSTQSWLSARSIQKIQEKSDNEFVSIRNIYQALLSEEEELKKNVDSLLEHDSNAKNRKVHLLLKKWHENAFVPLNMKIAREMSSKKYLHLDKEKRKHYIKYLNHCNKKGHVFLDIFDEDEYDPIHLNRERPGPIKAVTEKLSDPLLLQQNKRNEEDRIKYSCVSGKIHSDKELKKFRLPTLPLVPLGRDGTECDTWLGMKFTDIQSDVRCRSQRRMFGERNKTTNSCFDEVESTSDAVELDVFTKKNKWCKRRQYPKNNFVSIKLV